MKKLRLIAMFALTFALVFGVASCKNEEEEGPWGESLAEVLKAEPKLDLSGKWKAFEGDIEVEVDGPEDSELTAYMKLSEIYLNSATEKEKIEFICDDILYMPVEVESNGNQIAESLLELEEEYKKSKEESLIVMINGDRNEIRIEIEEEISEKDDKNKTVTTFASGFVTYRKK